MPALLGGLPPLGTSLQDLCTSIRARAAWYWSLLDLLCNLPGPLTYLDIFQGWTLSDSPGTQPQNLEVPGTVDT